MDFMMKSCSNQKKEKKLYSMLSLGFLIVSPTLLEVACGGGGDLTTGNLLNGQLGMNSGRSLGIQNSFSQQYSEGFQTNSRDLYGVVGAGCKVIACNIGTVCNSSSSNVIDTTITKASGNFSFVSTQFVPGTQYQVVSYCPATSQTPSNLAIAPASSPSDPVSTSVNPSSTLAAAECTKIANDLADWATLTASAKSATIGSCVNTISAGLGSKVIDDETAQMLAGDVSSNSSANLNSNLTSYKGGSKAPAGYSALATNASTNASNTKDAFSTCSETPYTVNINQSGLSAGQSFRLQVTFNSEYEGYSGQISQNTRGMGPSSQAFTVPYSNIGSTFSSLLCAGTSATYSTQITASPSGMSCSITDNAYSVRNIGTSGANLPASKKTPISLSVSCAAQSEPD